MIKKTSLFAERIKAERLRLLLNQQSADSLCGVSREMWGKYERDQAVPGGEVLLSFAAAGADMQFIFTGVRSLNFDGEQEGAMQVAEEGSDYKVLRRRDLINHIDNLEHCPPQVQDAIKKLAFVSADGGKNQTQPQTKVNKKR